MRTIPVQDRLDLLQVPSHIIVCLLAGSIRSIVGFGPHSPFFAPLRPAVLLPALGARPEGRGRDLGECGASS